MLSVSDLVNVTINLSPLAAANRTFGILLIAGDSNVINGVERIRSYSDLTGVTTDFGSNAPETKAATLYFGQSPKPATLNIGRWLRVATSGFNNGGILSAAEQVLTNWTSITNGGFHIAVDGGSPEIISGLNFSSAVNLNQVATIITAALTGAVCTFTGSRFVITSNTTGTSSSVGFATAGSGTDISAQLKMTSTLGTLIAGFAAESALQCATALAAKSPAWYGLMFQASVQPTDSDNLAIAPFIEALTVTRIFGVTITNTNVLDSTVTNDLASQLVAGGFKQSFCQYSQNPYAVASMFGRAFSVDFTQNRSTITLMYKQEPGVTAEDLSENQAATLKAKRCNVFALYVNGTFILQDGVMSGPAYFDEIHGLDWLQGVVQTACFNVLYLSKTKVPQTNPGVNQLTNAIGGACEAAVNNGLVAPGVWNADGFGQLVTGQFLKTGYYIFAQSIDLQSQSDRDARNSPPIQVAVKLAGAIHRIPNLLINVNR